MRASEAHNLTRVNFIKVSLKLARQYRIRYLATGIAHDYNILGCNKGRCYRYIVPSIYLAVRRRDRARNKENWILDGGRRQRLQSVLLEMFANRAWRDWSFFSSTRRDTCRNTFNVSWTICAHQGMIFFRHKMLQRNIIILGYWYF